MIYWINVESGNDTTGDGSFATPYKTPNKAISVASSDDEIRLMETSAHTTVTGVANFTFTVDSNTVATDADATGSFSVGDYIGKTTASGNGAEEHFYYISAIDASSITLRTKYYGTSEAQADVLKATIANTGENDYIFDGDRSDITGIACSGGWSDETTQDGQTFVRSNTLNTYDAVNTTNDNFAPEDGGGFTKINFLGCDDMANTTHGIEMTSCSYDGDGLTRKVEVATDCCFSTSTSTYHYTNVPATLTRCFFFHNRSGGVFYMGTVGGVYNLTDCEFWGLDYLTFTTTYLDYSTFSGTNEVHYSDDVFDATFSSSLVENMDFYNITGEIVKAVSSIASFIIRGATIQDCGSGSNGNYANKLVFENCDFINCDYGVQSTSAHNLPDITFAGCSFDGMNNYGCKIQDSQTGQVKFLDCTITAGEESTLFYDPNVFVNPPLPRFMLQGCETNGVYPDGGYWGQFSLTKDLTSYRTATPSLRLLNKSTTTIYSNPVKLHSMYVKSGAGKRLTFYNQQGGGWAGSVHFCAYLNGRKIKDFPSDDITAINATWEAITLTVDDVDVTHDGELAIMVQYYGNTVACNFDDFATTNV